MKKIMVMVLAAFFCMSLLAGCTKSVDQSKANDTVKKYKFGYTCMTMNNPFFITLEKSIREDVEKNGGTLITLDPQLDTQKQIAQVEDMIAQKVDLIFLNPVDWKGIKPALDAAKKANIPVVNFDAQVFDKELVNSIVVSDNFNAGKVCGEDLVKQMPNGGKIAVIDSPTMKSVIDRIDGFFTGLGDKKSKFEIVAQQDGKGQLEISMPIAEAILQANPDVKAFMGGNDPTALGIIAALKTANKKGILVYGVDGAPESKAAIKDGDMTGTGAQSPINIGKESYKIAIQILKGEQYEKNLPVKTELINKDNVDKFGIKNWQ
ncbi:sugar ABC transporter substrate-binding protein [Pelosinus propionicus]|uniref:Ribose transport system substrate-binding protein n=1 Tax=Pelosinus propionicus DSM 13327 TaxID=1123291 RepID=A0A1I4PK90_9FIRM|nr:sugar ABC transporter substrate-binding protein [Pelosinus propionicus]SFM27935.1 ribose transport system substrate-binding protein [Pelosinus propionicus DSM 13327]